MKREAKLLMHKACDSLVLSIELFNRPHDRGRISSTLIQLDHAFEMLLKSSIVHRGGRIRDNRAKETIGFDACVRRALSDGAIRFLSDEQALVLQAINGLRDAAQHHLLDISEGQLYVQVQSGVTLFRDLLRVVFDEELLTQLPTRVLPVSTTPPTTLTALFEFEVNEIRKLLQPGKRKQIEATSRLRPLAILDATILGEKGQPSDTELKRIGKELASGTPWNEVFKGASAVDITADGTGLSLALRLSKKEGIPIQLVAEGTPGSSVVAVRKVNELDFYNLTLQNLADKLQISRSRMLVAIDHFGVRGMVDCYKEFKLGSQTHKRYSPKALEIIRERLTTENLDDIWRKRRTRLNIQ
jgi:hypothetical protein